MTLSAHDKLYPSPRIRHSEIDGLIVILDLEQEQYHILDEQASTIWKGIVDAGGNISDAMNGMRNRLPGPQDTVELHLNSFVSQCIDREFLSPIRLAATEQRCPIGPRRSRSSALRWRACCSLALTGILLKVRGFRRTYESFGTQLDPSPSVDSEPLLSKAAQAFLWAENLVQFGSAPDDCLPRSLALFRFLRAVGLPVVHRIGGRRFPTFTMHAWVEHDGKAILDDMSEVEKDIILASLPG
jgi:hypothetical protein